MEGSQMKIPKINSLMKTIFFLSLIFSSGLFWVTGSAIASESDDITLEQALVIVSAARERAENKGILVNIAVVDAGANLMAFVRMDGAFLGSIDLAIKKARTSRLFNMPTGTLGGLSQPGKPLYNIEISNGGLITFPGGVPIKDKKGNVVGAIGVSGASVEDDHEAALAGAAALK